MGTHLDHCNQKFHLRVLTLKGLSLENNDDVNNASMNSPVDQFISETMRLNSKSFMADCDNQSQLFDIDAQEPANLNKGLSSHTKSQVQ